MKLIIKSHQAVKRDFTQWINDVALYHPWFTHYTLPFITMNNTWE